MDTNFLNRLIGNNFFGSKIILIEIQKTSMCLVTNLALQEDINHFPSLFPI